MRFSDAADIDFTNHSIIGRNNDATSKGWWFGRIAVDAENDIRFGTSTGNIKTNVADWKRPVLVVLVQRSDSDAAVYTDGNLNVQGNNGFNGPATSATPLQIGTRADFSEAFTGHISNVAFWDRALSDAEIRLLARDPFIMLRSDAPEIAALSEGASAVAATGAGVLVAPPGAAAAAGGVGVPGAADISGTVGRISAGAAVPVSVMAALRAPAPALAFGVGITARAEVGIASAVSGLSGAGGVTVIGGGLFASPLPRLSAGAAMGRPARAVNAILPGPRRVEGAITGARRMTGLWRATP